MSLELQVSPYFSADFDRQIAWYTEHASELIARRYADAVTRSLGTLCENPDFGPRCEFQHAKLQALRFWQVARPFQKHVIFFRHDEQTLFAERLMHGSRDLPRRLLEPPVTN